MTEPVVRLATAEDWAAWRDIRLRALADDPDAFCSVVAQAQAYEEADWRARVDGSSGPAFLAFVGAVPVGMGAGTLQPVDPGRVEVVSMWTASEWRGHGLGRAILDAIVGWAGARGLAVDLWVAEDNATARRLYERYGFTGTGETAPMREGSAATMTRYELRSVVPT